MKTETFVPLQTRPTWRTEARLAPNVSESAAAGLGGPSGCLLPRLSQPRRGSGFPNTHTSSQRAWGSGGAATTPRYPHAVPARRGGTAFPTRPPPALDAGAPAPTLGPRPSALAPPPRLHAPLAGPLRAPQGSGQPGCLWQPRERPQSKRRSKEKAKEEQRPGSCGLAWRWGWGGGDTESAGKAPGVARGLQAHPPLAAPLPSPSRAPGALSVQLLSPPLGPSPLRRGAQSRGLRERREGKREGKGRGGGERRTIPPKAGVEFQLRTLGPNCTPPPGSSSPSAAARRRGEPSGGLVCSLPGAFLSPSRPRSPPPAPRLSASLLLAPHLSFPWEGARSFRLSGVLRGACLLPWQGLRRGLRLDTDSSPGEKT